MALAECQHHSAQRQKKARAREEEREMHYTAAFRTTVPPPEPELFDLFEEPGGVRPNLLLEPQGPQDWDQLRTVEQTVGFAPLVQILDAPVAQMVEQLPNIAQFFDTLRPDPVQVIEVPKILPHDVPRRRLCRRTQLAEQLVEVPTIPFLVTADCGAKRRHSSSWSWRAHRLSSRFSSQTESNSAAWFPRTHF